MKNLLLAAIALFCLAGGFYAQETPHKAKVSTTIDFLDLTGIKDFYPEGDDPGYMTLEMYERCLKSLAELGITKLYLRVNVTGIMLFPSKVTGTYGKDGGHFVGYPDLASRVVKTLEHFDPCTETIRIGHELGMEVWAWENFYDDGAYGEFGYSSDSAEKFGIFPLMDKFYRGHPEYMAWPQPDGTLPSLAECAKRNQAVQGRHVGKIVFTSDFDNDRPCRVQAENLELYVSDDNFTYRKYEKPYQYATARNGKRNQIILSGLDIAEKFVKLQCVGFSEDSKEFTMGISQQRGGGKMVYDTKGKPMPALWGYSLKEVNSTTVNPLRHSMWFGFTPEEAAAFDYGPRAVGFGVGEPFHPQQVAFTRGMAELTIPAVMQHKLERFAEIAAYPFDGFEFSTRTHAKVMMEPDKWGFNPEVREKYMQRYGKDIWAADFKDYAKLQALRAEALDDFLAGCKKIAASRPIYVQVPEWPAPEHPTAQEYWNSYGSFPFNWRKWVANGSVDGIAMINWYSPDSFKELAGKAKLTVFREPAHVYQIGPEGLRKELFERGVNPAIDEIELYESCIYCVEESLRDVVKKYTSCQGGDALEESLRERDFAKLQAHLTQPITRAYECGGAASRFTWVFFGDSITSGIIHTHGARSFTEIFRNRVVGEKGLSLDTVINSGFSGLDTKIILDRNLYDSHVRFYRPDAVFIMLGMNDARGVNGTSRQQFKENIAKIVDMVRDDNAVPVLMTFNTIEHYVSPDGSPLNEYYQTYIVAENNLPSFMEAIREVAQEKGVILVDNYAHWQQDASDPAVLDSWLGETIHPGGRGHIEIAREIFKTLGIDNPGGNSMQARSLGPNARSDK